MHLKRSGIVSGAIFVLSFILGLTGRVGFPWILLRAICFGLLFGVLVEVTHVLFNKFLVPKPDKAPEKATPSPGSIIDISLDNEISEVADETQAALAKKEEKEESEKKTEPLKALPDKSPTPELAESSEPATESAELQDIGSEGFTPLAIHELYNSKDDYDIGEMAEDFNTDTEDVEPESYAPKKVLHSNTQRALAKMDPMKMAGAIRTLIKKD